MERTKKTKETKGHVDVERTNKTKETKGSSETSPSALSPDEDVKDTEDDSAALNTHEEEHSDLVQSPRSHHSSINRWVGFIQSQLCNQVGWFYPIRAL